MSIRKATAMDWQKIQRLIKKYPTALMQKNLPRPSSFFVALENTEVIGCCALGVYSKRLAEIRSLVVHEKVQGRGIATALIECCLSEEKKKKVYEVLTITGALKLFEKQGFGTFNKEKYALLKILD